MCRVWKGHSREAGRQGGRRHGGVATQALSSRVQARGAEGGGKGRIHTSPGQPVPRKPSACGAYARDTTTAGGPEPDPSPEGGNHQRPEPFGQPSVEDPEGHDLVGDYTSVQAGVADFGKEGESLEQLGTRLVSELTKDVKTELNVVHQVLVGKPLSIATQGVATAPSTHSPASAGTPPRGCRSRDGGG